MNNAKRCSRCIVRASSPGILLREPEGLCNICATWDGMAKQLTDFGHLQSVFRSKIERIRGRFSYDVVVGLSGGKDGSYLVWAMKELYGLKVLAVTFDLGFMPNAFAKENAIRVTETLGVEHQFVKLPEPLVEKLFRRYLAKPNATTPCHLCTSILGLAMGLKVAQESGIPKIVTGLDRGQLLNKVHLTHARKRILDNIAPYDGFRAKQTVEGAIRKLNIYLWLLGLSGTERAQIMPSGASLPGSDEVPELMMYFLYHPHNEDEIKELLEKKAGWVRPDDKETKRGHFDCEMKSVACGAAYRLGLGERLEYEFSVDIREGHMDRKEALQRLSQHQQEVVAIKRPFEAVQSLFGMSEAKFEEKVQRLARISPYYAKWINGLLKRTGFHRSIERLLFLIRPH